MNLLIRIKKLIPVAVLFILAFVLVIIMSLLRGDPEPLPTQAPSQESTQRLPIKFELQKVVEIPETLPVVRAVRSSSLSQKHIEVARGLGFDTEPEQSRDINNGNIFVWWNPSIGYLRVVPSQEIVDFKAPVGIAATTGEFPPEDELVSRARGVIEENNLVPTVDLRFSEVVYLNSTGTENFTPGSREESTMASVRFRESIIGYPLLNETPGVGTVNITFNQDGELLSIFVDSASQTSILSREKTRTVDDVVQNPSLIKVHNLGDATIDLFELSSVSYQSIVVTELSIAYLQTGGERSALLSPVYLLEGRALVEQLGVQKEVNIQLTTPAI